MKQAKNNPHAHPTDGPLDEEAYRRGFQQGAYAALQAMGVIDGRLIKRETPFSEKIIHWMNLVAQWRFDVTHKERIRPPLVDEMEK